MEMLLQIKDPVLSLTLFWALLLNVILWSAYIRWKTTAQLLKKKWADHLNLIHHIKDTEEISKRVKCTQSLLSSLRSPKQLLMLSTLLWALSLVSLEYVLHFLFSAKFRINIQRSALLKILIL